MPRIADIDVEEIITDRAALRRHVAEPSDLVATKVIDHIDDLCRRFIAASPLAILATRRADGGIDQTPRGDPPGFLHVLDDHTLALPDRPGNNRTDAFENVLADPAVGLLVLIPGVGDTLRIGGRATLVRDADLAERLSINGRPSGLILLIEVTRVLCHCPKAFIRSNAWRPENWPDTSDVPTLAQMLEAHVKTGHSETDLDAIIHRSNTERLY